mmetsp:Transcript_10110/g.8907  ORF Transcript_10110/g.8907 Transcript_10110/m.8907 type:complete len:328 (-) Transcript_10110:38-1021(-)
MEAEYNSAEEIFFKHNQTELEEKINNFIKEGIESVQILCDFDMTLTRDKVDGGYSSSCFTAIQKSDYVTEEYIAANKANYKKYRPIEKDQIVDKEEKMRHMEEWWETDTDNICKQKLSHENFMDIAKTCGVYFRNGITDLLNVKTKMEVPMLVVSAGIGELIKASFECVTEDVGTNLSSIQPFGIVSNMGIYEDEKLVRFQEPLVHIMNKAGHVKKFVDAQKELDEANHHHLRRNIIVMGDVVEDLGMIQEITYDNIIKVGYLNNMEIDAHLEETYEQVFDIVIQHDGNLWPILSLMELAAGEQLSYKDKLPEDFRLFLEQFEKKDE